MPPLGSFIHVDAPSLGVGSIASPDLREDAHGVAKPWEPTEHGEFLAGRTAWSWILPASTLWCSVAKHVVSFP